MKVGLDLKVQFKQKTQKHNKMISNFIIAFFLYALSAYISFHPLIKKQWYFLYLGLSVSLVCNLIWLHIAKTTENVSKLTVYGLYWDSLITFCFLAVPFFFFEVQFNYKQLIGIMFILLGIGITKL